MNWCCKMMRVIRQHVGGGEGQGVTSLINAFIVLQFGGDMMVYRSRTGSESHIQSFSNQQPLSIDSKCTATDFCLFYTSPVIKYR